MAVTCHDSISVQNGRDRRPQPIPLFHGFKKLKLKMARHIKTLIPQPFANRSPTIRHQLVYRSRSSLWQIKALTRFGHVWGADPWLSVGMLNGIASGHLLRFAVGICTCELDFLLKDRVCDGIWPIYIYKWFVYIKRLKDYDFHSLKFVEGSLEVKLPTIWTDGKAKVGRVREEKGRRKKI